MTPNPHPASGNGDVIERLRNQGKSGTLSIRFTQRLLNEAAAEIERLRGLLKLSEGSGDGKMRAAAQRLLDNARFDAGYDGSFPLDAETQRCINDLREALTATPAPSPIDAAGMREACAKVCYEMAAFHPLVDVAINLRRAADEIRALPASAPEIDLDYIRDSATYISDAANRMMAGEWGGSFVQAIKKEADAILSLIGGRHGC